MNSTMDVLSDTSMRILEPLWISIIFILTVYILLVGVGFEPVKATYVVVHITEDTTWTLEDSPCYVEERIVVDGNVTLTYSPTPSSIPSPSPIPSPTPPPMHTSTPMPTPTTEQPTQLWSRWSRTWGGTSNEDGFSVVVYNDHVYMIGSTYSFGAGHWDAFLAKYDVDGNQLWNTTWGGSEQDWGWDVAVSDGYIYITGERMGYETEGFAFLAKYDFDGNQIWNTSWGAWGLGGSFGVAVNDDIYIVGGTPDYAFLVKYDADGNLVWETTWDGTGKDVGLDVAVDGNDIYITGWTDSFGAGWWDAFLAKYDVDGNQLWNTTWGGTDEDRSHGVATDSDVYIVGETWFLGGGGAKVFLTKYDANGNQIWNNTESLTNGGVGFGVAINGSDIYATGGTSSFDGSDAFLAKYDDLGNLQWKTTWGGSEDDCGYGIAIDRDIYIVGTTYSFGAGETDAFLVKYGYMPDDYITGLEAFPYPFVDGEKNLQATLIYGQSDEHGPAHGARIIDVAGGTLVASTLSRESLYGLPKVLIDIDASTFDENQVMGITASGNLITIGGGDVNLVSRYYEFLEVDGHYAMPVVDIFNEAGWSIGIKSRHSDASYYRQGSYGKGTQVTDYALAALYNDGDRYVLWIAGISGFTTRAMCGVLTDYQSYSLSGVAVILQFIDNDGDGTFESIDIVESIPHGWSG